MVVVRMKKRENMSACKQDSSKNLVLEVRRFVSVPPKLQERLQRKFDEEIKRMQSLTDESV